jgi:integrase/recombinase XerD
MIYWVLYLVGKGGYLMRLSALEFHLEDFLLACQSKSLAPKTLSSYEQSLKPFLAYLKAEPEVEDVQRVKAGHIGQYVAYVQE